MVARTRCGRDFGGREVRVSFDVGYRWNIRRVVEYNAYIIPRAAEK